MYAVTLRVEAGWRALIEHVAHDARVTLTYVVDLLAQPLDELCMRSDLGAVHKCGYTVTIKGASLVRIACTDPLHCHNRNCLQIPDEGIGCSLVGCDATGANQSSNNWQNARAGSNGSSG